MCTLRSLPVDRRSAPILFSHRKCPLRSGYGIIHKNTDQLMRQDRGRQDPPGERDRLDGAQIQQLDQNASSTSDDRCGSK